VTDMTDATIIPCTDESEWRLKRRLHICATDAAGILGVSPWATPLSVWAEKTGRAVEREPTRKMRLGKRAEPMIADEFALATNRVVTMPVTPALYAMRDNALLACTPDRFVPDEAAVLELKYTDARDWDHIPIQYQIQVQHQLMCLGMPLAYLAVLVGAGRDFHWFQVLPNLSFQDVLRERLERWWRDYVVADVPPSPTGHDADTEAIKGMFPTDSGETVEADAEVDAWHATLMDARQQAEEAQQRVAQLEQTLKLRMGEASELRGTGYRYTYRTQQRRPSLTITDDIEQARALLEANTIRFTLNPTKPYRVLRRYEVAQKEET